MARDNRGNNIDDAELVLGGSIALVEYDPKNKITRESMAEWIKTVELPEAYGTDSYVGLISSDGGPQDGRDGGDVTEFYQGGYQLPGEASLTLAFTVAENNRKIRRITLGEPDEYGVYAVNDIIQDEKWCCYAEELLKGGRIRRRAGVVQVSGNEPNQSTRGEVKGQQLTLIWIEDDMYDNAKYFESVYDPENKAPTTTPTE